MRKTKVWRLKTLKSYEYVEEDVITTFEDVDWRQEKDRDFTQKSWSMKEQGRKQILLQHKVQAQALKDMRPTIGIKTKTSSGIINNHPLGGDF